MCNVPQNLYDNGDCCLASIVEHYCHNKELEDIQGDCICHEDGTRHPGLEGKKIFSKPVLQYFSTAICLMQILGYLFHYRKFLPKKLALIK